MPCDSLRKKHTISPLETKDFIESFEKIGFIKHKQKKLYALNGVMNPISIRERDLRLLFNAIVDKTYLDQKSITKEILSILDRICISLVDLCKIFLNQLTKKDYLEIIEPNNELS